MITSSAGIKSCSILGGKKGIITGSKAWTLELPLIAVTTNRASSHFQPSSRAYTKMASNMLANLPKKAPEPPKRKLQFADVAVTATAKDFAGFYRNKQYHEADFPAVLDRALVSGVEKVMLTGMSLHDVPFNLNFAESRPKQCFITVGVHPYHASEPVNEAGYMEKLSQTVKDLLDRKPSPIVAFGELGLDYDRFENSPKEHQIQTFKAQLDLFVAEKFDLPLFLHCRSAFDDFVAIIKPYLPHLPRRGLVHSFVGSASQMKVLAEELGFDVSVNGFSFRDQESLEMVREIPLEKLQIETDAPWGLIPANSEVAKTYLARHPGTLPTAVKKRDKFEMGMMVKERNEPCMIDRVAFVVAGLKDVSVEDIATAAWKNSVDMFRLDID